MRFPIQSLLITLPLTLLAVQFPPLDFAIVAAAQTVEERKAEGDRLLQQGIQQRAANQVQEAVQSFQQALEAYRTAGDRAGEGRASIQLGDIRRDAGDYSQAIQYYEQALAVAREFQDWKSEFDILLLLTVPVSVSDAGRASELLQQARAILETISLAPAERQYLQVEILFVQGNIYDQQDNSLQAIQTFQQGLEILRDLTFREELARSQSNADVAIRNYEAGILEVIAKSYAATGQNQAAIEALQQALAIAQSSGNSANQVRLLGRISQQYTSSSQFREAVEPLQMALAIVRREGDRNAEAGILQLLGASEIDLGRYQSGFEYLQQAEAIVRQTGNLVGLGLILGDSSLAYLSAGQYQKAISAAQEIVTLGQTTTNPSLESMGLDVLFTIYAVHLDQFSQAEQFAQQQLKLAQRTGDRSEQMTALGNLGFIYSNLGQYEEAEQQYQQALAIAEESQIIGGKINLLFSLSQLASTRGNSEQAITALQEALRLAQQIGDSEQEAQALINLGTIYSNLEQYTQAETSLLQALAIVEQSNQRFLEQTATYWLSSVYLMNNQYAKSIEYANRSIAVAEASNEQLPRTMALFVKAQAIARSGNLAEAESLQFSGLEILETLRSNVADPNSKVGILNRYLAFYRGLQSTLIAQDKIEEALEVSERGRARVLLELLSNPASDNLINSTSEQAPAMLPTINLIKQIAQQQNSTLVEYTFAGTDDQPFLYIYIVQSDGNVQFRSIPLSQANLTELIQNSRTAIGARGRSPATVTSRPTPEAQQQQGAQQRQNLQQLYKLLIEPIAQYLPTNENDRVIFIPQGELFLVPFAALMDANGDYLIEHHTILTSPSIQVLDLTRQQRQRLTQSPDRSEMLVVGNPTMPEVWNPDTQEEQQLSPLTGAEQEARTIAAEFQTQPLLGSQATETVVKQRMPNARFIHLATHGLLDYGNPQESGVRDFPGAIALAPSAQDDGLLTSAEIYAMNLNAELVVLSACDTGRGRITGDGVIGLSRSLMQAGVPSVLVSLWEVPDEPTAQLMTQFYRNLEQTSDKAQALRQAMLTTMQDHHDPINWAAFTLIGEAE